MTAYVPPDSRAAVVDALRTLLAARAEPYAQGVTVGTRRWDSQTPEAPGLPYVLVASDGIRAIHWPAAATDLIRITTWAASEDDAYDLTGLSVGLLAEHRGGILRGLKVAGLLIRGTDRDTQTPLCSGLLTAALRPIPAA